MHPRLLQAPSEHHITPKYILHVAICTKTILPKIYSARCNAQKQYSQIYILHAAMHKNNTPKYILHVAICTITKTMWPVCSRLLQAPSDYHIPSNYAVPVALYTGTVAGVLRAASSPLNIISSHCIQLCSACCTVHRHCGWCAEGCLQPFCTCSCSAARLPRGREHLQATCAEAVGGGGASGSA